jgi:hypothetical protein
MSYRRVERVITVEFVKQHSGKGYEIVVTPEQAVVRYGDKIVWDVQGLPAGVAKTITIGNWQPLDVSARIIRGKKGLAAHKPKGVSAPDVKVGPKGGRFRAILDPAKADPGCYKYEIKANGRTLLDPDVEWRGPKS